MEGQEYLNQISASNRPMKKSMSGLFSSRFFIVGVIGLVALILIIIIGAIIGSFKDNERNMSYSLKLHLENTATIIQDYQSNIKSSNLRSSSASLYGILTNTDRDLTDYLVNRYDFKENEIDGDLVDQANLEKDELEAELFEAKINGIFDRIYAHKMVFVISSIMSEEEKIINSSKNDELVNLLVTSYNSLENLYTKFNDFSEVK